MMMFAAVPPTSMTRDTSGPTLIGPPSMLSSRTSAPALMQQSSSSSTTTTQQTASAAASAVTNQTPAVQEQTGGALLHPPRSPVATTTTQNKKSEDASYLVSFSATISDDDADDFVILPQSHSHTATTPSCFYTTYCGALNCWDADSNSVSESTSTMTQTTLNRYEHAQTIQQQIKHAKQGTKEKDSTSSPYLANAPKPRVRAPPRIVARQPSFQAPESILSACWQHDPILQARHSAGDLLLSCGQDNEGVRRVRFTTKLPKVHEYPAVPAYVLPELFWSDGDGYELRAERRGVLQAFKRHISYAPLVPWTEQTDSIRGLEDHYAEMIGRTSSYYIRKRHEELILREFRRLRYAPNNVARLAAIAEQSAEDERERAVEMARLDECMARADGEEGATTSPVGAPLFTSGEAFLHTLMVRLRDYT